MLTARITEFNERHREIQRLEFDASAIIPFYREVLAAFPDAPVLFWIRNFTVAGEIQVFRIEVEGLYTDCEFFNIAELWPELNDWVSKSSTGKNHVSIPARAFIESGEEIATLIQRELSITHQYGSGKQECATLKGYGPFKPRR